jgi:hypothetical protein
MGDILTRARAELPRDVHKRLLRRRIRDSQVVTATPLSAKFDRPEGCWAVPARLGGATSLLAGQVVSLSAGP